MQLTLNVPIRIDELPIKEQMIIVDFINHYASVDEEERAKLLRKLKV